MWKWHIFILCDVRTDPIIPESLFIEILKNVDKNILKWCKKMLTNSYAPYVAWGYYAQLFHFDETDIALRHHADWHKTDLFCGLHNKYLMYLQMCFLVLECVNLFMHIEYYDIFFPQQYSSLVTLKF